MPSLALLLPALLQAPSFPPRSELEGKPAGSLVTRLGAYDGTPADWGFLLVPENGASEGSRLLALALALVRQRATKESRHPPIFNLVGGPGRSNVFGSGSYPPRFLQDNDIVRVGYRGVDSDPELTCPEFTRALQTSGPLSPASIESARKALRACNDRLRADGVDLDGYTIAEVVQDIEAARVALGYERISFQAVSYGTQVAFAYAMLHPERVHRMLLVGAGGRARGFDLWPPALVDARLHDYAKLWSKDREAVARTSDLVGSIRKALASLPAQWRGVAIDRDKVRLAAWTLLEETETAAQLLVALVDAARGDPAGLALLSAGYDDELAKELARKYGPYHGEFFCKVASSGLSLERDWVTEMEPQESILGSPAAKLLWGAASRGGWPVRTIPEVLRRDADVEVETLVVAGNLDLSAPPEFVKAELMPRLKRGRLVVLSDFGHTGFIRAQPEAFAHLAARFLYEGAVDDSRFEHGSIDFTPTPTLGDQARRLFPERGR